MGLASSENEEIEDIEDIEDDDNSIDDKLSD